MSYTVELSNGKVFTGIEPSGNCYKSLVEVKAEDFTGGLSRVSIRGKEDYEGAPDIASELEYPELGGVKKLGEEWYFWFHEKSAEARELEKLRADTEYVAMMTGVEL